MERSLRVNDLALSALVASGNAYFKFVVSSRADVEEALRTYIEPFAIPRSSIYLMPAADNREALDAIFPHVAEWAKELGYQLSNRMHIQLWNKKTGV
jgi:6-pyruvoyltetrahydropterin 2'-reductase